MYMQTQPDGALGPNIGPAGLSRSTPLAVDSGSGNAFRL